jgi:hypothetical protein
MTLNAQTIQAELEAGEMLGLNYRLQLPQSAATGSIGSLLGRRAGSSLDFQDFREYQPGDDLRRIDWNAYARSDKLTVKLYREEVTPHLDLILDVSSSMDLPDTPKAAGALRLCAALAAAAKNARCSHAVWTLGKGFQRLGNDSSRPPSWSGIEFGGARSFTEAFSLAPPRFRPMGIRILIRDLFWSDSEPEHALRRLSQGAAAVYVLHYLCEEDIRLPEPGNLRLEDHETGEAVDLFIDSAALKRYEESLQSLEREWMTAARRSGAYFGRIIADTLITSDPQKALRPLERLGALTPN